MKHSMGITRTVTSKGLIITRCLLAVLPKNIGHGMRVTCPRCLARSGLEG